MKIALINDTHAGARQESLSFNNYFFEFWDNTFFPYLKANNIKKVVHLGDLVDRRKFINYVILNSWREKFFNKLVEEKISTDFLVGNHDVPYRNTNSPNAIRELLHNYQDTGLFNIYEEAAEVKYDKLPVLLMPWINNGNYESAIDRMRKSKSKVCFGHFEISGFEMDRGSVCESGLKKDLFDKFELVLSGHFHHKSTDGSIYYLGSQYEMTWSDYDDPKGFHVFDTGTMELEFVRNPYSMFHKIWYNDAEQDLEYWKNQDLSKYTGRYVKVIVTTKNNPFLFDKMIDLLYQKNPQDITVVEDYGLIYEESSEVLSGAEDTPTILSKYVDGLVFDVTISKDKVKKVMRDLYNEALTFE
jgi:DNA repair exonuclease SbcCD nuclease subunit